MENQVILGLAIIYSWLFTRNATFPQYLFKAGLSIPAFLLFLGFVRWIAIQLKTMKVGGYLCRIEESLAGHLVGLKHFLAADRTQRPFIGQFE